MDHVAPVYLKGTCTGALALVADSKKLETAYVFIRRQRNIGEAHNRKIYLLQVVNAICDSHLVRGQQILGWCVHHAPMYSPLVLKAIPHEQELHGSIKAANNNEKYELEMYGIRNSRCFREGGLGSFRNVYGNVALYPHNKLPVLLKSQSQRMLTLITSEEWASGCLFCHCILFKTFHTYPKVEYVSNLMFLQQGFSWKID